MIQVIPLSEEAIDAFDLVKVTGHTREELLTMIAEDRATNKIRNIHIWKD